MWGCISRQFISSHGEATLTLRRRRTGHSGALKVFANITAKIDGGTVYRQVIPFPSDARQSSSGSNKHDYRYDIPNLSNCTGQQTFIHPRPPYQPLFAKPRRVREMATLVGRRALICASGWSTDAH
eukprot:1262694-Pyramimonas_sp.AAC.2